jgi:hypothetical protein
MKRWMMAGVLAASATLGVAATAEAADGPARTVASVFRMPKAEAIGAALGAIVSVNLAAHFRSRKGPRKRDDRERG